MENINLKTPDVTVVMPTYNEPSDIIYQSIASILGQTLNNLELLIIDDSTNPETRNKINELASDKRVTIIRENQRIGFVKALNLGLKQAKGKFIARMDGDDVSVKNRLELQLSFLEKHSQYSVVGGAMNIINEEGIITNIRTYPASSFLLHFWSAFRSPVSHPTIMMRREIIDKGYFYDENFLMAEDTEYWLRLMKNGFKFYNLPDILLNYRVCGEFVKKRSDNHFINNYKARYKNFSWESPVKSILSIIVARAYILTPDFVRKKIYSLENKKAKYLRK